MPRQLQTRRAARISADAPVLAPLGPPEPLISLVTRATRLHDLLPHLHRLVLEATRGASSLLFEHNARSGALHAISGTAFDRGRTNRWTPRPPERELMNDVFARRLPTLVVDAQTDTPDIAARLGVPSLLLLPLARGKHRTGLLAVGFDAAPAAPLDLGAAAEIGDAFLAALELFRLRQQQEMRRALRELLDDFGGSTATLNLLTGLEIFCNGARRLFAADRVSVWIHDRRARQLELQASSGPEQITRGVRISADDAVAPAAAAMRRTRAEISAPPDEISQTISAPLRGCRRALGAIVFEGVRVDPGRELDLLDGADELARQLSSAIENMQLLEDVVQFSRKLASSGTPSGQRDATADAVPRPEWDRLPALGVFVAGLAHELNNPLQGVLGHLELLRATGAFPKQLRREVQTIYREADRAAKIVRNLLVFAGSRRIARRSVNLNAVLQKVAALRQAACRALDIEFVRHYDDALPRVQSDPLLLHQVFLNIVMNAEQAIAATGRPGRIEIGTSFADSRQRILATVRDTGSGIPRDVLPRIFEPFYTTKEVGKGTGLGLAIAYGIVHEHGGEISASNSPDGGALFTVELPAVPERRSMRHD